MTIALAQNFFRSTGTDGASTVATTKAVGTGSGIGIVVGSGSGQTINQVSDGSTNGTFRTSVVHTNYGYKLWIYTWDSCPGGTLTWTATFSAGTAYPWIGGFEISGTSGYDDSSTAYAAAATSTATDGLSPGNMNTTTSPTLLLALIYGAGSSSPQTGPPAGVFDTFGGDGGIAGLSYSANWATQSYRDTTATGTKTLKFSNGNSADNIALLSMAWKEGNSGSPLPARRSPARPTERGRDGINFFRTASGLLMPKHPTIFLPSAA